MQRASMWLSGYGCQNAFFVFFACFRPYIGQPDSHISWATLMPFTSIIPTDYRTNPTQYHEKILRIDGFAKHSFLSLPFWIFFAKSYKKQSKVLGEQGWVKNFMFTQGLLNRWTSQLDLGCTNGGLERVVSVHNST